MTTTAITTFAETKVAGCEFGDNRSSLAPATWYVALLATDPGKTGDLTGELAGGSYARVAVPNTTAKWTASGGKVISAADVVFPAPTAAQGYALCWALVDAPTAGNVWHSAQLDAPTNVTAGMTAVNLPAGSIVVDPT